MKNYLLILGLALFLNQLSAQTTAVNESFETWPPSDWSEYMYEVGGWEGSILWGSNQGYGGGNCAKHKINNDATDDWLVSPQVDIISDNYELNFFEQSTDLVYYTYQGIYISTGSGDPEDGDFVELAESLQVESTWVEHSIDLSAYNGESIYIAFVYQGATDCWTHWDIDEVTIAPSDLIDGALTEILNPVGINPSPSTENATLKLHNFGSDNITSASIEWSINSIAQTPYTLNGVSIAPGEEINVNIGSYNFASSGDYQIDATLLLDGDINLPNNEITGMYYVSDPKDAKITNIKPNGYLPSAGEQEVIVSLINNGDFLIDDFAIAWSVNEVEQTSYEATGLGLAPGEEAHISIGNYSFADGINNLFAQINLSADDDLTNNSMTSYVAVNMLWESFESDMFPPEMWSADDYPLKDYFYPQPHGPNYYVAMTDNNMFGAISDTLYTPLLNIEDGDVFSFWVNNSAYFTNSDVLIWKDGSTGEVHLIGEIESILEDWTEVTMDISTASGINYIGVVNEMPSSFGTSSYDLFTSTANVHHFDNDLGIKGLDFEYLAKQDEEHVFNVNLRNYGLNTINGSDYSVQIISEAGDIIAEETGINLDSWEEANIIVPHTFTSITDMKVYAKIVFSADEYLENNKSTKHGVYVVPADYQAYDIGQADDVNLNIPFNTGGDTWTLGSDDISQILYYDEELGGTGFLYGITLYYHELHGVGQNLPLDVWIKQTNLENLEGGWIPIEEMQMVFNDSIEVFPGHNSVYIPFDEPILITDNNNVAIQFYQYNPSWPSTACRFYASIIPEGPIRSIRLNDVYELDPYDLPDYFGSHSDHPFTTFIFQNINETGDLNGMVSNESSESIENALISVIEANTETYTNSTGHYNFADLAYTDYTITAEALGYYDQSQEISLDAPEVTADFTMIALPIININGQVFGSNAPSIPLENVLAQLNGYEFLSTNTNTDGQFNFESVYGAHNYTLSLQLTGYDEYIVEIEALEENIDLGEIILTESKLIPFNVYTVAGSNTASIEWEQPIDAESIKLQNDNNTVSYSLTNEPYEDVRLGNYFENNELITITSVEIQFDIYDNATDLVSIDILDEYGELLISSASFLTYNDTILTVDIPNLSIESDFYAMLHWKDNELSTDALAIDYSESVPNSAYIQYPNSDPQLLSDFLGMPVVSALIRVNSLQMSEGKSANEVVSYNIYKGPSHEIHIAPWEWEALNAEPITDLYFIDYNWGSTGSNTFSYAIEAIYTEGNSEFCFSNFVEVITATDDIENMSYSIYPNPTSDLIYLEGLESETIFIYNLQGILLHEQKIDSELEQISLQHLSIGEYLIQIGQNRTTHKIMIHK
ncbi:MULTISPECIES: T9SS-dependent choice-of-anchor J family protein [unclassified Lentimicrobium]|uniref:T9SS-dependent choice-of-anchor J family protein n=1 Tax=unclassified Lentimicrobium TaxID=2677434 RepID=UPI001555F8C0|nr:MULTISPECIES: choice-of-anchor J domain-containing protein [unclassified Lentimicrobium]NPD45254.1 T9SS type A sorting domain-containing protein [Lentimicrobium sp. S6]NPD86204.1 T9SS type A sorting domain-containing protein [Lentimicrobium sp. L6]